MKILVCGSRHGYDDVMAQLDRVADIWDVTVLIQGGAPGVDQQAKSWALTQGVTIETFLAEWDKHGRSAGPRRNQRMIDEGRPDGAGAQSVMPRVSIILPWA